MTPKEQAAFVEAYANNVADASEEQVKDFVRRYAVGEDMDYSSDYTSIMDALMMWNAGIKWQMEQAKEALELSMSELNRHARDTESGERAVQAVQTALGATA